MKQGTGHRDSAPKERFVTSKVSLTSVSEMGAHPSRITKSPALFGNRKVEAPRTKVTQHHTGSQGKR